MSVDPGFGGTGVAYWVGDRLVHTDILHGRRSDPWWEQAKDICPRICRDIDYDYMFFEQPFFIPNAIGNASQDITKLTMLAGMIFGYHFGKLKGVYPVEVMDWKGQVKKEIMHPRIKARLPGYRGWKSGGHDVDAVGLGLWVTGRLG